MYICVSIQNLTGATATAAAGAAGGTATGFATGTAVISVILQQLAGLAKNNWQKQLEKKHPEGINATRK